MTRSWKNHVLWALAILWPFVLFLPRNASFYEQSSDYACLIIICHMAHTPTHEWCDHRDYRDYKWFKQVNVSHQQKSTFLIPSYSILFHLTTSFSSYFEGKKGISRNKTSFFLLMQLADDSGLEVVIIGPHLRYIWPCKQLYLRTICSLALPL